MNEIAVTLWDADTDEEFEGVDFPHINVVPREGETIHYWQDGTEEDVSGVPVRRDFIVKRVRHDWRYMPGRSGGRAHHYVTVELFVSEVKAP